MLLSGSMIINCGPWAKSSPPNCPIRPFTGYQNKYQIITLDPLTDIVGDPRAIIHSIIFKIPFFWYLVFFLLLF